LIAPQTPIGRTMILRTVASGTARTINGVVARHPGNLGAAAAATLKAKRACRSTSSDS
jgi:hypothetical protein